MSIDSKTSANTPSAVQQRRQANILLLRLQWLLILLLIIALVWLYIGQQRFQNKINERMQSNEQVVSRLNEMDDRLFAISQHTLPEPSTAASNQAQNQLELLRIQIQAADRLLTNNDHSASIELLRGLQWQLSQDNNKIAPTLTIVIKQSLNKDIEQLQAQSSQPSPWQLQNLAIQNIQAFLHGYERKNSNHKSAKVTDNNSVALTRRQLTIHEVIMTLNLAIQASNMRDQDQLNIYLGQARQQLQTLVADKSTTQKANDDTAATSVLKDDVQTTKRQDSLTTMEAPANIQEVIVWLDKLIANTPVSTSLLTTQILEQKPST